MNMTYIVKLALDFIRNKYCEAIMIAGLVKIKGLKVLE